MTIENQSVLEITNINGRKQEVEVVLILKLEQTKKKYIVYTLNEQKNGMIILYASSILEQNDEILFETISDAEWLLVKNKMCEIVQNKGDSC